MVNFSLLFLYQMLLGARGPPTIRGWVGWNWLPSCPLQESWVTPRSPPTCLVCSISELPNTCPSLPVPGMGTGCAGQGAGPSHCFLDISFALSPPSRAQAVPLAWNVLPCPLGEPTPSALWRWWYGSPLALHCPVCIMGRIPSAMEQKG